ncbi:hypothetical protein AB0H77_38655 [Streptomyces sp. NPDC050844]|uniref:hypothetical protein n=1 Tax=Streptomyces sp. NPDC050844 TaxID=3155790 RepID=UPI0033DF1BFB
MRKPLMVMVVALMAAIGFTAPAQATVNDVPMPFGMSYGNSTTTGKINFTDGYSASVSGVVHAASGRRMVCAYGVNGGASTVAVCSPWAYAGGPNQSFGGPLRIPRPGGVQRVVIMMQDENYTVLAQESCTRNGCTREI